MGGNEVSLRVCVCVVSIAFETPKLNLFYSNKKKTRFYDVDGVAVAAAGVDGVFFNAFRIIRQSSII